MAFSSIPMNPKWFEPASKFVDSQFPAAVAKLGQLVKIPGIAWPSFDQNNLELSAKKVADELGQLDFFDFVEIRKAAKPSGELGAPAVIARKAGHKAAPHILLYAHHDVQPPGDSALWDTEPFEATLRGDRLFGRGASDDKSGIITHLTSLKTLISLAAEVRVGVTVFIEGEEEAGSESFPEFLKTNHSDLAADLIIVADSGNWSEDVPALTTALRGMVSQTFTLKTLDHALHSGMYGGPLPDATTAMIRLLASLTDEAGNVAIVGLDSVSVDGPKLSEKEFALTAGLLPGVKRLGDKAVTQQMWGEPAVTIIGLDLPAVDVSSNTAQPWVRAKISLRLSPSQSPESGLEALRKHLSSHAPFGAQVEFGRHETGPGYLAKDGWAAKLAHEAFSASWPNPSVNMGIGGSIPFISQFAAAFPNAEILVTGVEEPDSRAHSPNESQHLPTLRRAILAQSLILLNGNDLER
jgi:acetylornithine deacetylase/succinyl-diaminopimelate desuccinylase-like protein